MLRILLKPARSASAKVVSVSPANLSRDRSTQLIKLNKSRKTGQSSGSIIMPPKRKRSAAAPIAIPNVDTHPILPPGKSRPEVKVDTNPDHNAEIVDGKAAMRASPDADEAGESFDIDKAVTTPAKSVPPVKKEASESELSEAPEVEATPAKKKRKTPTKSSVAAKKGSDEIKAFVKEQAAKKAAETKIKKEDGEDEGVREDPDEGDAAVEDADAVTREANRPPPVNSDYLPLPWKGRLGYACLNTYLRLCTPPVFSSRTCRIQSILDHRHPLQDPSQPEHATKNRPDKTQPADVARGQRYVEELGIANAKDIVKMLRWNEKYGIRFLRLSSEMFPFASHDEYGYRLAPFAAEALAEAGRVAAELGHRLTTHPGQFTQLGSPRPEVIKNAIRDLEYHSELLSLLKMPPQEDRDAVMILHLGGTFGDKAATLDRFRENYLALPADVKKRLVLENDDVSWSVHELLPLCEELNIPMVLDFHHHNIIFDPTQIREGTHDIRELFPRIIATWERKQIRPKMHYSEGTPQAVTGRQRRKHNPRPFTLPPCPNDMDLMIEAKDKEQAVFELMRTFKLPGFETFNDIVPYERADDNKPAVKKAKKKKTKKQIAAEIEEFGEELKEEEEIKAVIPDDEVGMGGPHNRVYWPPGMEEWLRPKKREIKKKGEDDTMIEEGEKEDLSVPTPQNFAKRLHLTQQSKAVIPDDIRTKMAAAKTVAEIQAMLDDIKASIPMPEVKAGKSTPATKKTPAVKKAAPAKKAPSKKKTAKGVPTPSASDEEEEAEMEEEEDDEDASMTDLTDGDEDEISGVPAKKGITKSKPTPPARVSRRASSRKSYVEIEPGSEVE